MTTPVAPNPAAPNPTPAPAGEAIITEIASPHKLCKIPGCLSDGGYARGWCNKHWKRWYRHGDPERLPARKQNKATPKASKHPTIRDIAWAAGFFEGEGSFHRTTSSLSAKGSLVVTIPQVNKEPVLRLQELFGGSLLPRACYDNRTNVTIKAQPLWIWQICGARARGFTMTIFSLLSQRRQQQAKTAMRENNNG